jgi:hypothetical protein
MAREDRFVRLKLRRVPQEKVAEVLAEARAVSADEREYRYLVESMQPIDPQFTENTFREGERVRKQLAEQISPEYSAEFAFQGSVTSDTHIRVHSDIDLLLLNGRFVCLDPGVPVDRPYGGDVMDELVDMRAQAAKILRHSFPAVNVDESPGKAISLEGGSLQRKIDVVVGNWWDTERWRRSKNRIDRGVRIIDTKAPAMIRNMPYMHNYQIQEKDRRTAGLRKAIRLLKTLKYDADPELTISSYDIAAVAWNMPDASLSVAAGDYRGLAKQVCAELKRLVDDKELREKLVVPNGTRKVFGAGGATLGGLKSLCAELADLLGRIDQALNAPWVKSSAGGVRFTLPEWHERRAQSVRDYLL